MRNLARFWLIGFVLVFGSLVLCPEAKADPVRLSLADSSYDLSSGRFTLSGFFTNLGAVTFTANRWDVTFAPNLGLLAVRALGAPDCCNYTQPVPGMSSSPMLPLLEFEWIGALPPRPGSYLATLAFSGVAGSDLNVTTDPVQFLVTVPEEVPEPATLLLLGSGMMAGGTIIRRRRSARQGPASF